jgi:hypothetical protein
MISAALAPLLWAVVGLAAVLLLSRQPEPRHEETARPVASRTDDLRPAA